MFLVIDVNLKKEFIGSWRIEEMDAWDSDFVDMITPGNIKIQKSGQAKMHFGCVDIWLDFRMVKDVKYEKLEFTFEGNDENDSVLGRGWAIVQDDKMKGHIYFHLGDDSSFIARKIKAA